MSLQSANDYFGRAVAIAPERVNAGVLVAPRRTEVQKIRIPSPKPQEILLRVEGCGLCGSNLPVWQGRPWFNYPLEPGAPGHEAWGVVEATGSEVTQFFSGDRVAFLSNHGFAAYDVTPASQALLLPMSFGSASFPGEPLGCAMNVARRAAFRPGEKVAVVGIGFLGALLTRLAKLAGCTVIAISRREFARAIAETYGANETVSWDDAVASAGSSKWNASFDCVIESVGTQQALDLATQLAKERGRLVIAGYHQDGMRQVDMQLWNWRGLDVINAHERDPKVYLEGMRAALEAVMNGSLDPSPLYTHMFPLGELHRAFEMLESRPAGFMKALVLA